MKAYVPIIYLFLFLPAYPDAVRESSDELLQPHRTHDVHVAVGIEVDKFHRQR
jgi:hypothetical protein